MAGARRFPDWYLRWRWSIRYGWKWRLRRWRYQQGVFDGDLTDAALLKSLLAAKGIDAQVVAPVRSQSHKLVVRRVDAPDARALIEDWHRNHKDR